MTDSTPPSTETGGTVSVRSELHTSGTHQTAPYTKTASPIMSRFRGMVALVALLIAAGVSASVVGYRVKSADWERTRTLESHYRTLKNQGAQGATGLVRAEQRQGGVATGNSALAAREERFVLMYEVNEYARVSGLIPLLEAVPRARLHEAAEAFEEIGALDAAHIIRDALTALAEDANPARAHRIAKRYSRSTARDTAVKLFRHIAPPSIPGAVGAVPSIQGQ